ncbi:ABC-2 transporter permease [Anaerococcus sp. mt242]|uniref:ABC-2 transporter permease n=1 Tax=Anaerococcus sp. mt242 TaxID=2661917 RepID=UPI001931C64D|nr:ABC-2 transporter permease [Anaerococcus sp. mt242]MBM0046656.1 ABC-2 transporter permease [Anaerococcus sp. mt242]
MSTIKIQWHLIKSYLLPILYYMLIASIMTIQSSSIIFSALLAATLMAMKLTSLPFEVDTNENLDKFYGSLPVSTNDFISSRYGLMIIIGFIGIILSVCLRLILVLIIKKTVSSSEEIICAIILGMIFYVILISLQLPLYYRYGTIKVRLFSIIPVIFYVLGASLYIYTDVSNNLIEIIGYLKSNIWVSIITFLLVSILVGYISFTISNNIVKKKE